MLRSLLAPCLAPLAALLAAEPAAAQLGRRPGSGQPSSPVLVTAPQQGSGSYTGLGMKRAMFEIENATGDDNADGVENACGFYWITGRGLSGPTPPGFHAIYQLDLNGNKVATYMQNPSGSPFGHRDMARHDPTGRLWAGEENGRLVEYQFNPSPPPNGVLSFVTSYVIPGVGTIRALTHDPDASMGGTDVFIAADLNGPIHVFSINPIVVINTFPNPGKTFTGFGYDEINSIVWAYSQDKPTGATPPDLSQVNGLNPANGQLIPGLVFQGVAFPPPNVASGATVFRHPQFPCSLQMAVITQSAPDMLVTYDLAVPLCAPPEHGINVDIGVNTTHPLPSQNYGAASGPLSQPGVWNPVPGSVAVAGTVNLVDTSGAPSAVTLRATGGVGDFQFNNVNTTGDADRLLDDLYDASTSQWVFSGLADGEYAVYVYAWASDSPLSFFSDVTIQGGMKGTVSVGGGDWAGVYVDGVHFLFDQVSICGGADLIVDVATPMSGTPTSVNGFQIVPQGASRCATTFCTAKAGLTCGTPAIAAYGAPSATNTAGWVVSAAPARSCRSGILLYNTAPAAGIPFQGGTLCVSPMGIRRAGSTNSLGTRGNFCDGAFSIDMNRFTQGLWQVPNCAGTPSGLPASVPAPFLLVPGTNVFAQFWGRDALATGSFLSDAVAWTTGP
jgi:hypothetical protein